MPKSDKAFGKKQKDPNAPKRPANAYMQFANEIRPKLKAENSVMTVAEIAKEAGARWKSMSAQEKSKYEQKAQKLLETYKAEVEKYNAKK